MNRVFNIDDVSIYKTKIDDFNQSKLVDELKYNIDINNDTIFPSITNPGIESSIVLTGGEISNINNIVIKLFDEFIYQSKNLYSFKNWVYLSSSENEYAGFHSHTKMDRLKTKGEWTWTFYIQMPDNLKGDDGKLHFKINDEEFSILPKEGELLLFPANVLHMPNTNTSSNKDRIVLAGTLSKIDLNKSFVKHEKTLF